MRKIIFTISFISLSVVSFTQPKAILKTIAEELNNYQDYKSYCYYTFSFPYGDPMSIESTIVTQKVPVDTLNGFYYHFETNENFRKEFGDFAVFFNNTVYNSYKGKVKKYNLFDKPEAFRMQKMGNGYIPAKHQSHQLYFITPYKLANQIIKILDDYQSEIYQRPDTVINQAVCYRFILMSEKDVPASSSSNKETVNVKTTYELCFHKSKLYPVFYKKDTKGIFFNSFEIAYFTNTKVNIGLQQNYFSEENLLQQNLKNNNQLEKLMNPGSLVGKKAPDWDLPILGKDEMLSNRSMYGKYILLEFTATWCAHCMQAGEMMNRLEERFKDNEDVALVSIFSSYIDKKEGILKFVEKFNLQSTILYSASDIGKQYYIHSYPNFMILSPKGKVLMNFQGYNKTVESNIISVLSEFTE